jgi:N-acetylneuraminic acid mutarotase
MIRTQLSAAIAMIAASAMSLAQPVRAQAPAPSVANPWFQGVPFPEPSQEVVGATAHNKLYVFAGLAPGWRPKSLVFEYDPAANQWVKKKPQPLASHHAAFASFNNRIYAFGGFTFPDAGHATWVPNNTAWEYDPATDQWKELAPMPTRRGAAAAAVANGKIYVSGGAATLPDTSESGLHPTQPHGVLSTVEEYDPATNSWRARRSLLLARNHHESAGVGDKIYVIGGRVGSAFIPQSNNVDLVEMYDPATDMWSHRARMPTARSGTGVGVYNGKIIVAGGESQDNNLLATYKSVEAYDPAVNRWQILPPMRQPRHGLAVGVIGNRLYAVSGYEVSGGAQAGHGGMERAAVAATEVLQLDLVSK